MGRPGLEPGTNAQKGNVFIGNFAELPFYCQSIATEFTLLQEGAQGLSHYTRDLAHLT